MLLYSWHVRCLRVTSPAGCRCHWLRVFRCRGHWAVCRASYLIQRQSVAEQRAAHAQTRSTPAWARAEGGGAQSPVRARPWPDRKRAAKYNLKCWQHSNSGKLQGAHWETGYGEHSYSSDLGEERGQRGEDQYGHWWWWTVIHGQSGGVEIVPVIPAKIVNKWTHKHGALLGLWLWVSLLQTEAWSGSVGGEGEAGQWFEGNQNECQ